jgi:enoyl-CoA hydratase
MADASPAINVIDSVVQVTLDDGKANAVGHSLIDGINEALDRSEADEQPVLIGGRSGVFSAGFDLKEFQKGEQATTALVSKGAAMFSRLFAHPAPVVAACTGHAIAAGGFMLLAADTRFGARGDFKIGLNETAIGMSLPVFALELSQARLSRRHMTSSVIQAQLFDPDKAVDVGFLDELTAPDSVLQEAMNCAQALGELPVRAYGANKRAIRAPFIAAIEASLS